MNRGKVAVVIQARMGSTRLPGKVMRQLAGKTVLAHVIDRCREIRHVDDVVVATSDLSADDAIVEEATNNGVACIRGSEADVLSRFVLATEQLHAEAVIRVTSDCPLLDPTVSSLVTQSFVDHQWDYCSNTLERTYPRGLDTEIFTSSSLFKANQHAITSAEREHVTKYMYDHPDQFRLGSVSSERDFSHHRWTLDTIEDWTLIESIYAHLYDPKQRFEWTDVLELMNQYPELQKINAEIEQKKI